MNKVFYLSTCDTCRRILKEIDYEGSKQDIKSENISAADLDFAKEKIGSYEALFNKRAQKYRKQGLNEQDLSDAEFRQLILDEYTFLKRPLFFINSEVFAGNSKSVVAQVKEKLA